MKVPQHNILPSVDLKVVASEELQEEVEKELANAAKVEAKDMTEILKANKAPNKNNITATLSAEAEEDEEDED
jgi:hypothetical protein